MLPKPLRVLWGDLTIEEVKKFGILAATLSLIIGTYWMLRVMKNPSFDLLVGFEWQPRAKFASIISVAFAVLFYSKLVDFFAKKTLFYIICLFYGLGFVAVAYFISNPDLASVSSWAPSLAPLFAWIPGRGLGWFSYLFLESFGSIVPALFWSFVASTTTTESAKRGYAMIMSCTQIGTILGPTVVKNYVKIVGLPALWAIGGTVICIVPLMISLYSALIPQEHMSAAEQAKPKTGMLEGMKLLLTRSYLMGILVVVTMYEVISTIIEYQMNTCIKKLYPASLDGGAKFAELDALNGQCLGVLSFVFALLGTSFFMRRFGLKFCLISFPTTIGITVLAVFAYYLSGAEAQHLMWAFFSAVVVIKGLNYALNNPSKEILYIPTSKDVKFKTKGWIDAFGNRTAKACGALVTDSLGSSLSVLVSYGTVASLAILAFWISVAPFVGNTFGKLQAENKIIE